MLATAESELSPEESGFFVILLAVAGSEATGNALPIAS
ncbi:hypothetical protein RHCRD62_40068 [Rhodococcus sp. RD6.2]|nr:hypothetical protein RHCRD62_40068 [Rhodococcus sp. RD6.2]